MSSRPPARTLPRVECKVCGRSTALVIDARTGDGRVRSHASAPGTSCGGSGKIIRARYVAGRVLATESIEEVVEEVAGAIGAELADSQAAPTPAEPGEAPRVAGAVHAATLAELTALHLENTAQGVAALEFAIDVDSANSVGLRAIAGRELRMQLLAARTAGNALSPLERPDSDDEDAGDAPAGPGSVTEIRAAAARRAQAAAGA